MQVEAVALAEFVHGDIEGKAGHLCRHKNGALIDEMIANDLEKAGLVRIRMTKDAPPVINVKTADDGQGQPSSSSPAARPSVTPTSSSSKSGGTRLRKSGM